MDKLELRKRIKSAFADVPYPGDERIGDPNGRDDGEEVAEGFRGQDWRSLKANKLWPYSLYWMTVEAYQYYLPAYLLAAVDEPWGDILEVVLHRLTPPSDYNKAVDSFQERHSKFTPEQRQVIRDFLDLQLEELPEYLRQTDKERPLRETRDYWNHF